MKKLSLFAIYAMAALAMIIAFGSCKKEINNHDLALQIDNDEIVQNQTDSICNKGNFSRSSIGSSENDELLHSVPNVVTQLAQDPDYGDYYYFDSLYHDCSLDTAGYYVYAARSKYFPNCYLAIAVKNDSILMYYEFEFPTNFNWEYSYNHNETVPIYAYLYDGTPFYSGTFDVKHGILNVTWVNLTLFDLKGPLPPGWNVFCGYWTISSFICPTLIGLACPPAGVVIGAISCVVSVVHCL